jgi:hypothetical protein
MDQPITQFVVDKLNEPGVLLGAVSESTGIPVRTLQHLKAGGVENMWAARLELLARHFGYRLEAVLVTDDASSAPRRRATDRPSQDGAA